VVDFIKDVIVKFLKEFVFYILWHVVLILLRLRWKLLLHVMHIINQRGLGNRVLKHIESIWILAHWLDLINTRLLSLSIIGNIIILSIILMLLRVVVTKIHVIVIFEQSLHVGEVLKLG